MGGGGPVRWTWVSTSFNDEMKNTPEVDGQLCKVSWSTKSSMINSGGLFTFQVKTLMEHEMLRKDEDTSFLSVWALILGHRISNDIMAHRIV